MQFLHQDKSVPNILLLFLIQLASKKLKFQLRSLSGFVLFHLSVPQLILYESPALDGVGIWVENKVKPIESKKSVEELTKEISQTLKESGAEILVSYLPVGSEKATKYWAQICLDAKIAFVNCMPSFIASDPEWSE